MLLDRYFPDQADNRRIRAISGICPVLISNRTIYLVQSVCTGNKTGFSIFGFSVGT